MTTRSKTKLSKLSDLASYAQNAEIRAESRDKFWTAFANTAQQARQKRPTAKVGDLLGTVMALSARTRRMVQPKAFVEIDVFAPGGQRAVQIIMQD